MRAWKVVVLAAAIVGFTSCFPQTYEDCVLEAMEGGSKTDDAIRLIARACREKFPVAANDDQLSPSQMANLTTRGGPVGEVWSGSLYNGNEDVTVTEVEIHVTTIGGGEKTLRRYRADVHVPPLKTGTVFFPIIPGDEGAEYSWSIGSAKGRKPS